MNKYQQALDNYSENVDYRDYSTKTVDIVNESYDTLQELVDKTKIPTLEQIKKEWEENGWKWKERDDYHNGKDYRLYFVAKNEYSVYQPRIFFRKYDNTYYAFEGYDTTDFEGYPITEIRVLHITLDLQNLITKTLQTLQTLKTLKHLKH